jgi:eukaryotic-like serine/threonine-protein kinase
MALSAGTRLGPYQITSRLGAGGMGEVYKARDTRLDRVVAIKVLPEQLASDPSFRERFDREARTISQLDHPRICTLHDVGEQNGMAFLVMQYLEGETLAHRLESGALSFEQAMRYACEIAEALEMAHRAGIVHRDLKPGNIMLTRSGAVLLDFGLAKDVSPIVANAGESRLPTSPGDLTAHGTILGTFQYMAPEQLDGATADARTDIFAFGAVLHEMITGRKAFEGRTQASVIAAIMHVDPPPVSALQPLTPTALDRIVRKCIAKDPHERWQSASDLLDVLKSSAAGELTVKATPPARSPNRWTVLAWTLAVLGVSAAAVMFIFRNSVATPSLDAVRFSVAAPAGAAIYSSLSVTASSQPVQSLSPDGRYLMFLARRGSAALVQIWVRSLASVEARELVGTEGAVLPFWSPDSRSIGFFAGGKLKRIDVSGGSVQTLADATSPSGGAWSREGTILFAPNSNGPLYRVPSVGGVPPVVTSLNGPSEKTVSHRWPAFLPDGRHFLFLAAPGNVYVGSLDMNSPKMIVRADSGALYGAGYLLFQRQSTLLAQPFDATRLELSGEPRPVAADLGLPSAGSARFSVAGSRLSYLSGESNTELRWFDRRGTNRGSVGPRAIYINPSLSADDARVMVGRRDRTQSAYDLMLFDLVRNVPSRFTFDGGSEWLPLSSPDGRYVAYTTDHGTGKHDIYRRPANGTGEDELVFASETTKNLTDWTADGRLLMFDEATDTASDLSYVPVSGDRKAVSYLKTKDNEQNGHLSADGRWIAYQSDESGRYEIYVRPFPDAQGGKWQISSDGGQDPRWRRDGLELYYFSGDNHLIAAAVRHDGTGFNVLNNEPLFQAARTTIARTTL